MALIRDPLDELIADLERAFPPAPDRSAGAGDAGGFLIDSDPRQV